MELAHSRNMAISLAKAGHETRLGFNLLRIILHKSSNAPNSITQLSLPLSSTTCVKWEVTGPQTSFTLARLVLAISRREDRGNTVDSWWGGEGRGGEGRRWGRKEIGSRLSDEALFDALYVRPRKY